MRNAETGFLEVRQYRLTNRVIKALGFDDGEVKVKWNPSESKPISKYKNGLPKSGKFIYSDVFGFMM